MGAALPDKWAAYNAMRRIMRSFPSSDKPTLEALVVLGAAKAGFGNPIKGAKMSTTVGTRVGAICSASDDGKKVFLFGYGVYEGDEVPSPDVFIMGIQAAEFGENPKIRLDSGEVVYGCECWWGEEAEIKAEVATYEVVETQDLKEYRRQALAHAAEAAE